MPPIFPDVTVLLGDPRLPDLTKVDAIYSREDLESIQRLKTALGGLTGYQFRFLDDHGTLLGDLLARPPQFVLNLCDTGFRNAAAFELHVPALLEMLQVPYSGATPACMCLCFDKSLVRAAAAALGIAVPREKSVDSDDPAPDLPDAFPALLKPNTGDGSLGITQESVVHDREQARSCLARLRAQLPGRAVLMQEFLQGPEYGVCLVGNPGAGFEVLPVLEVDYSALDAGLPRILGYESKTLPDSPYWNQVRFRGADLSPARKDRLVQQSQRLFARLGCRDYARFDFRSGLEGEPRLLEVNPNPAWCWDGKMNFMAGFAGYSESDLFGLILEAAQKRYTSGSSLPA